MYLPYPYIKHDMHARREGHSKPFYKKLIKPNGSQRDNAQIRDAVSQGVECKRNGPFCLLRRPTTEGNKPMHTEQNNNLTKHSHLSGIKSCEPEAAEVRRGCVGDVPVMISTSSFVMAAWRPRLYCIVRVLIMSLAFFDALSMALRLLNYMRHRVRLC